MLKRDKIIAAAFVVQIVGCATYYTVRSHRVDSAPLRRVYIDAEALIGSRTQILGRQNTPFTLVEFADYQCPPCARANSEIKKILGKNPDRINFCFRNFPLPSHEFAKSAAIVAEKYRSTDQFWIVHDRLFADQDNFSLDKINNLGGVLKRQPPQSEEKAIKRVQADIKLGELASVQGTPTFFLCRPDGTIFELQNLTQVDQLLKQQD